MCASPPVRIGVHVRSERRRGGVAPLTPGQVTTVPTRSHMILFQALDDPSVVYLTDDNGAGQMTASDRSGHVTQTKLYRYLASGEPQDGTVALTWNC